MADTLKQYRQEYYIKNKEKMNLKNKNYRETHREQISMYRKEKYDRIDKYKRKERYYSIPREQRVILRKKSMLKWNYGITIEEYQLMLKRQDNKCAICEKELALKYHTHIDHNHKTGKIRGILCGSCNVGIGMFKDNLEIVKKAVNYLAKEIAL